MEEYNITLDDVYINLALLSKIEVGNKLKLHNSHITIDTSYLNFITRWFTNSNRDETLKYITQIINKSFEYLQSPDIIDSDKLRILNYLTISINGLNNMKQTYMNDKLIQAKIDVIIENIQEKKYA